MGKDETMQEAEQEYSVLTGNEEDVKGRDVEVENEDRWTRLERRHIK